MRSRQRRWAKARESYPVTPWIAVAGVTALAGGLLASCAAAGALVARRTVTPNRDAEQPVRVLAVRQPDEFESGMIRLSAGFDTDLQGARYSLLFDQRTAEPGHARLGAVLRQSPVGTAQVSAWVERELLSIESGTLRAGSLGRITGWWYPEVNALDDRAEQISYATDGGAATAWVIPPASSSFEGLSNAGDEGDRGRSTDWAIHVHGRGARPSETLRGARVAAASGRTSLVITYRGDEGAPAAANNRYGCGAAEWRDVSAAMAEAVRRGATRITLFGWSMGGTACLLAAERSPHAALVNALVLDSPALNWRELIVYHASLARAPRVFGWLGGWLLETGLVRSGVPGGLPLRSLTPRSFAAKLRVPTLIHCSPGDTFVPMAPAAELARLRPDFVTLHQAPRGEHVRLWNVDPEQWDGVTRAFLDRF